MVITRDPEEPLGCKSNGYRLGKFWHGGKIFQLYFRVVSPADRCLPQLMMVYNIAGVQMESDVS